MRHVSILWLAAAIGCSASTPPTGDLDVRTAVAPSSFRIGDSVTITFEVTNRGSASHTINVGICPSSFLVTTTEGTIVGPGTQLCDLMARTRTLAPGEQYTLEDHWIGGTNFGDPSKVMAPGTYLVRSRTITDRTDASSATIQIRAK